uniref:DNA-directed RNA polymerase subunit beta n=1 Tax=Lepidodinium chlorophorum TaxID=107758 RepID=A0A0F7QZQ4_LEPCH|nr:beta subunit of RNA polymerase [Lepidodinium chlorophorum]BAR72311.1 beta subunit of RNA polymerase [Lepidodinium chlorophorum]
MHTNRFFQNFWTNLHVNLRNFEIQLQKTPNFFEFQQESFFYFIKVELQMELERKKIWFQTSRFDWTFNPENVCFEIPIQSYQETIRRKHSYRRRIFIPRLLYYRNTKKIRFYWSVFGNLPVLTKQGHFLINGSPRVCITQMLRGSGVYTSRKINRNQNVVFYIDFVPKQGRWVRIEKDFTNLVWFCIQKEPRITIQSIFHRIDLKDYFITMFPEKKTKNILRNKNLKFYKKQTKRYTRTFLTSISNQFQDNKTRILRTVQKFLDHQIYDIGCTGRKQINKRFNQKIPIFIRCLIPTDFIRAVFELNKLNNRTTVTRFDDFDSLRMRRICPVGVLLQREINQIVLQIEPVLYNRWNKFSYGSKFTETEFFNYRVHRFVTENPLFQFADQVNPLTNITQKRRLTGFGNGGLKRSTRNKKVRNIHSSHFGRICPIETPDGFRAGIVNSPTINRQINEDNLLQSIYILKKHGWIHNTMEKIRLKPLMFLWIVRKKTNWITRLSRDLIGDILSKFQRNICLTSIQTDLNNFYLIFPHCMKMVSSRPEQTFALRPNLIPFIQNNDGNRVLIRASILRQSLSTIKLSSPRISSSIEIFIIYNGDQNLYVYWPGVVIFMDATKVMIQSEIFKTFITHFHQNKKQSVHNNRSTSILSYFIFLQNGSSSSRFCLLAYLFGSLFQTNQSTLSQQYPCVKKSKWIQTGDLLSEGKASVFGYFAVGQNLFIRYIPWDGLNFEDGVVATEQLVIKETFTSMHIEKWNVDLSDKKPIFILHINQPIKQETSCITTNKTSFNVEIQNIKIFAYKKKKTKNFKETKCGLIKTFITSFINFPHKKRHNLFSIEKLFWIRNVEIQKLFFTDKNISTSNAQKKKTNLFFHYFETLDTFGFIRTGIVVVPSQILILRVRKFKKSSITNYERLVLDTFKIKISHFTIMDASLFIPFGLMGRILNVKRFSSSKLIFAKKAIKKEILNWNSFITGNQKINLIQNSRQKDFFYQSCSQFIYNNSFKNIIKKKTFSYINFCNKITDLYHKRLLSKNFNFFFLKQNLNKNHTFDIIYHFVRVYIVLALTHRIQIGDKLAGRHGNKGILSRLVPSSEIPFLPNGISLDIILNPLGIPSRINIGQIYETLLGLSRFYSGEQYLFPRFDIRKNNYIVSRCLVLEKLCIVNIKISCNWIFDPKNPGKYFFIDGRTCEFFEKSITAGEFYVLKLVHIVEKKIHVRRIGPYSLVTQQPVRGRARIGGQRIGEIEVWALERRGASHILQEMLTIKSDDVLNRGFKLLKFLRSNKNIISGTPEAFHVLSFELKAVSTFFSYHYSYN